jgi:hypothetical protein
MKLSLRKLIPVWFLLAGCGIQKPPAPHGVEVGSAGDSYSQEFVDIGYEVLNLLISNPVQGIDESALRKAIDSTTVVSQEELFLNGNPVDAINYPNAEPPFIQVSRKGWDAMRLTRYKKIFLDLHEYLGIMKIDDSKYQNSTRLDRARVCFRTTAIRLELERQKGISCYKFNVDDLRYIYQIDLRNRGIRDLRVGDFASLFSLTSLNIAGNQIKRLPPGIFSDLGALVELDVSGNQISTLEKSSFAGLTMFKNLSATRNTFGEYQGTPPRNPAYTVLSDYWYNPITAIRRGFTQSLPNVESVTLCPEKSTFLTDIESGALGDLSNVKHLALCFDFSNRPENYIAGVFANLPTFNVLELRGRGFGNFPKNFFKDVVRSSTLNLILDTASDAISQSQLDDINENTTIRNLWVLDLITSLRQPQESANPIDATFKSAVKVHLTRFNCPGPMEYAFTCDRIN